MGREKPTLEHLGAARDRVGEPPIGSTARKSPSRSVPKLDWILEDPSLLA
jgi:hypothetical protein